MRIAKVGDVVAYTGSKEHLHGLARVLTVSECWCHHCNGAARYRLAPLAVDGTPDMDNTLSHVRPGSVRLSPTVGQSTA